MGRGNLERKLHLVKWKVICLSKDKGGLRIRGLVNLNREPTLGSGIGDLQ